MPIGTRVSELLEHCGVTEAKKVLYGGPMMGLCLYDTDQPVLKNNNAILAFKNGESPKSHSLDIRSEDASAPVP